MKQSTIEKLQNLAVSMQLVTVEDMQKHSIPQLVTMIANKMNELIQEVYRFEGDVSDVVKTQNDNIQYLLGEGLHLEVATVFENWMNDGTFDTLINQTALKKVNDRIDETNAQLCEINSNFKSTFEAENVKLGDELLTSEGWVLTGWTGDFINGFQHTAGQVTPLRYSLSGIKGKTLKIELTLTNVSGGAGSSDAYNDFTLSIGGTPTFEVYEGSADIHTFSYGLIAKTNDDLIITPRSEWNGKITKVSVKEIIGGLESTLKIKDSNGEVSFEITNTKKELNNVFIGQEAGKKNLTGNKNVAIGGYALKNNTTGFWNTAIGTNSLEDNLIGSRNIAIGLNSLQQNMYGDRNIGIGTFSLNANTTGRNNVALGADALWHNTSGNNNIGISNCALDHNTTGSDNIALGYYSLYTNDTGSSNIAIGRLSLNGNVSGRQNIALGEMALYKNTAGIYNIAVGRQALLANTTGGQNIAVGSSVLSSNTTGSDNIALGDNTLSKHASGNGNIALGKSSIRNSTNGSGNVALGGSSLEESTSATTSIAIGLNSMRKVTSSLANVAVGVESLGHAGTGGAVQRNVAIGHQAGTKASDGAERNIFIGPYVAKNNFVNGQRNILIGNEIDTPASDTSDYLSIGNLIYGNLSSGKIGIGVQSPTGYLHIKAGNASTPTIVINRGVLTNTPVPNALEYNGSRLFLTTNDGVRKEIAFKGE